MEHKRTVSKDPDIFHYDYDRVCIKDDLPSYIRQHTGSLKSPDGREEFAILEWTPERHRFFTDISDALEALVGKLQSLKDVKVVDKLIASRVPLLPPAQGAE